VHVLGQGLE
jgi:hypothetical protein